MTTLLHKDRIAAVESVLNSGTARSVLDLGCGDGDFFLRMAARPDITRLVGIEIDTGAVTRLEARLRAQGSTAGAEVRTGSVLSPDPQLAGFDCAVMIEVIEHLDPSHLSQLERALFHVLRPRRIILTTPNAEFNPLLGVPTHRFRHPGHRFEWTRARFRDWAQRVALRGRAGVSFADIGGVHPDLGGASQMAVFHTG
ncbi:methyltransferase domain-containing protein [Roseinatronobacter bogoriensis]|uniref:Small RNA 2'-O-methyltransferase n=1 Tax=Roseinatronobacter bogoriensis subsp. barguzinensis TaxID=441209 RepID=A0A2K8KFC8_9RHOB|nr:MULTISPECIES: methyltransferase domain-containing protein [Rhodobaca]ATX66673.1 methyltransferase type 12 [Rhodobaca barguzinensis]MBB4207855.1 2-polyprenyl-3-methyl-5-hydroxy-6-metoxy-1,4-benzoquinol methylase [Rhodobaca bogoriensis DSM 18756]TDW39839.1 methyltransferase family protein [Rhodobaca barguzinensis]TDY71007.1 methyltransferase family protein [Rhodobaca bogoriensis DSM 18756]